MPMRISAGGSVKSGVIASPYANSPVSERDAESAASARQLTQQREGECWAESPLPATRAEVLSGSSQRPAPSHLCEFVDSLTSPTERRQGEPVPRPSLQATCHRTSLEANGYPRTGGRYLRGLLPGKRMFRAPH